MATPHVAAAVALAAQNFPGESVAQRIRRLLDHVTSVPALSGKTITGGRLNLARSVDADSNGLPDWWELQYFGHLTGTDPNSDPDADAMITRLEFYAGTDPTRPQSRLQISETTTIADGTGFLITWTSVPGKTYRVEYSDSPAGPWRDDLPNSLLTAPQTSDQLTYADTTAIGIDRRFYRVRLVPEAF